MLVSRFCSRLFLCVLPFVFVGFGRVGWVSYCLCAGLAGISKVYVLGWVGLVMFQWRQGSIPQQSCRSGGPIPPGMDKSVGPQVLHANRVPGHPP